MSWDILIQDFPATARTVADIPDDFQPQPIGLRADLIAKISDVVPAANFSNPEWGVFDGDGFSIEFNMGNDDVCGCISLMIRGGGGPTPLVAALLDRLQLRGIDCQTGEFFDIEAARASFGSWQQYRDQILGATDETKS
jgi:hypothetical protein